MTAQARFMKAINSLFRHQGTDGFYQKTGSRKMPVRVIFRQPDPLFELGDRQILVDQYRVDVRVSECASPRRGDVFFIHEKSYSVEEEPRLDQHQLVWILDVLPVKPATNNGSRLRVR